MSSSKQEGSGTPFDLVFDLVFLFFEGMISLLIWLVVKQAPKLFTKGSDKPIELKHLKSNKKTTNSDHLGYSVLNKKALDLKNLKPHLHTLLIGASGWGKSNTLNLLFENSIKRDLPIIYIDPKGSRSAIREFKSLCSFYKKKCYVFSDHFESPYKFNTFLNLSNDEIVTSIMRSFEWSEVYYKAKSQSALFSSLRRLREKKRVVTLVSIYEDLREFEKTNDDIAGLMANLEMISESSFKDLLDIKRSDIDGDLVISPQEIKDNQECLYIGLSTQGKGDIARVFGKLFLNSVLMISHYAGRNYSRSEEAIDKGISFVIDEAGSMIFQDFIELLNKCRSSGINVYACIQSPSDFKVLGQEFMEQCLENFGTWMILKQGEGSNAEYLAQSIGTIKTQKETQVIDEGFKTGKGSIRNSMEYRCQPDVLKSIGIGKLVLVTRDPYRVDLINVRYVNDSEAFQMS